MILATFVNDAKTFAIMLNDDGTVQTIQRRDTSDVWSPPSEKIGLESAIHEFKEMLSIATSD